MTEDDTFTRHLLLFGVTERYFGSAAPARSIQGWLSGLTESTLAAEFYLWVKVSSKR